MFRVLWRKIQNIGRVWTLTFCLYAKMWRLRRKPFQINVQPKTLIHIYLKCIFTFWTNHFPLSTIKIKLNGVTIPQDYIRDNYCPTLGDHQHFCRESLSRYYVGMLVQFPIIFCLFPNLTSLSRYPPCSNVGHLLRCSFSYPTYLICSSPPMWNHPP